MQDVKFLEKVWHLLITHGGVCKSHGNDYPDPINYYSGNFNADREATEEALKYIVQHGVKYTECSDITGGTGSSGGSLTEILEVPYLMGELVTGNGKRYYWGTKSNALSLPMILKLLSSGYTLDASTDSLKLRLQEADDSSFCFSCKLD